MGRLKWARWFAAFATALILSVLFAAWWFKEDAVALVRDNEQVFKLVGLGLGPFLAVMGFVWGFVDKVELKHLASELGKAKKSAEMAKKLADAARAEFEDKENRIKELSRDLGTIADAGKIWKLRGNAPFPEYRGWKFDPEGARVVTIGLFKGGVGKTHLAANFAAYVSEKQQKPVLLIDLDYQGSLSFSLLSSAGIESVGSCVDDLFSEGADLATLSARRIQLAGRGPETALNGGYGLARAWLVPADYTLAEVESRLLVDRVMNDSAKLDERYRLAHVLLHPHVRRDYALILIDTPPRMTLGTVNALVASHCYVVPTILDRVSSEAIRPFFRQIKLLKEDLNLNLRLAGIVPTLTKTLPLDVTDRHFLTQIAATAIDELGPGEHMLGQNLPRKSQVTKSNDLGYFLSDNEGRLKDRFYDAIFDELWTRIMAPHESL